LANIERDRLHAEEVAKARAEAAEKAKAETEARLKREAEAKAAAEKQRQEAAEAARLRAESMKPDREKLEGVAVAIRAIVVPTDLGQSARPAAKRIYELLEKAATVVDGIIEEEFN
jgi:membrane protein involved in colicin uptake